MKIIAFIAIMMSFLLAQADIDFKQVNKSVFKIESRTKKGPYVATAFILKTDSGNVGVTNNHVCGGFADSSVAFLRLTDTVDEIKSNDPEQADLVTEVYMAPGADICLIKTKNLASYPALKLADKGPEIHDKVTVTGYVGRSISMMTVEGRAYGSIRHEDPAAIRSCADSPPSIKSPENIICVMLKKYMVYQPVNLTASTANIGPGFSGSPVLNQNGKVSGIVARYFVPSEIYSNGDGLFYDLKYLKASLQDPKYIKFDSEELAIYSKTVKANTQLRDFLTVQEEETTEFIKNLIRGL
jgi:S1-C subfamily serine protease